MADVVRRKISNEEAAKLGLTAAPEATRKKVSNEEAAALGVGEPTAPAEGPSTGRAVAEGALQGGSYGFGDELQGVIGAVLRRSPGLGYPTPEEQGEGNIFAANGRNSFGDDYRNERDAARRDRQAAETAHPTAFNASQLASAILSPGPKAGKTIGSFGKAGLKAGAAYGLGASDADLTKGDVVGAGIDTGIGAGVGWGAGLFGGAANKYVLQPITQKLSELGQRAFSRGAEKAQKPIDAAINSARGTLGGEVAAGSRGIEMAEKAAVNPRLPEDVSRSAADALSDAEVQALEERVARSQIGGLHGRLPRIEKAQGVFDEKIAAGSPEARKAAVDAFMAQSPMKRALWEIFKRVGPTVAGAGIGGAFGGNAGAGVGGTLGLLTGAMSGRPGRIVSNALSSPQFQRSAAQLGERAAGEMAPGALKGLIGEQAGNQQSSTRQALEPYLQLLEEEKK